MSFNQKLRKYQNWIWVFLGALLLLGSIGGSMKRYEPYHTQMDYEMQKFQESLDESMKLLRYRNCIEERCGSNIQADSNGLGLSVPWYFISCASCDSILEPALNSNRKTKSYETFEREYYEFKDEHKDDYDYIDASAPRKPVEVNSSYINHRINP
ncbi:MAG: hypothetical protein MRY83_22655 [Flavobacteriales bacterium]|nr:hypothetical protein [Flavobacteriales bacterium]